MFSSLKIRNYRLFFIGQVVSNTGTWMQRIAQDWLVLSLTGSSAAVGITTALQFLPMLLFGLYGGVLVDRLPKRPTLLVTQSAMALTGLALAFLTLSGHVQVWHVYVAAFAVGLATVSTTRPGSPSSPRWSAPSSCRTRSASTRRTSSPPAWSAPPSRAS
jgi:MFS family permease